MFEDWKKTLLGSLGEEEEARHYDARPVSNWPIPLSIEERSALKTIFQKVEPQVKDYLQTPFQPYKETKIFEEGFMAELFPRGKVKIFFQKDWRAHLHLMVGTKVLTFPWKIETIARSITVSSGIWEAVSLWIDLMLEDLQTRTDFLDYFQPGDVSQIWARDFKIFDPDEFISKNLAVQTLDDALESLIRKTGIVHPEFNISAYYLRSKINDRMIKANPEFQFYAKAPLSEETAFVAVRSLTGIYGFLHKRVYRLPFPSNPSLMAALDHSGEPKFKLYATLISLLCDLCHSRDFPEEEPKS